MSFKIETLRNAKWEECWVYPMPKNYKEWIREFEHLCNEIPNEKFRLVRYIYEVRLESK